MTWFDAGHPFGDKTDSLETGHRPAARTHVECIRMRCETCVRLMESYLAATEIHARLLDQTQPGDVIAAAEWRVVSCRKLFRAHREECNGNNPRPRNEDES